MLVLILIGILCSKTKIISQDTNRQLSSLVLQVVNPVVILMSFQTDYRPELAKNLLITFGLSAAAFVIMITISYILVRSKPQRDTAIERFASTYSNCGFMGIPLMNALFGAEGVFYLTAFITVFNISVWTHGVILISGERNLKQAVKVLYSPTIIAIALGIIMFFIQIKIPSVPAQALQFIADMNTPLAMLVSGITISQTNVIKLLKKPRIYYILYLPAKTYCYPAHSYDGADSSRYRRKSQDDRSRRRSSSSGGYVHTLRSALRKELSLLF